MNSYTQEFWVPCGVNNRGKLIFSRLLVVLNPQAFVHGACLSRVLEGALGRLLHFAKDSKLLRFAAV